MKKLTLGRLEGLRDLARDTEDLELKLALAARIQTTMVQLIQPPRQLPHQIPGRPKKLSLLWI